MLQNKLSKIKLPLGLFFLGGSGGGWRCVCFGFHCSHIQTEMVCLNISGCLPHCLSVSGLVGFSSALFCCSG